MMRCLRTRAFHSSVRTFAVVVLLVQMVRIPLQVSDIVWRNSGIQQDFNHDLVHDSSVNASSSTRHAPREAISRAAPVTAVPLEQMYPDVQEDREQPLGYVIAGGGEGHKILGEPKGDPAFKANMLFGWNAEIRKLVKNGSKLQLECERDITVRPPNASSPYCPCYGPQQRGNVEVDWSPPSWRRMAEKFGGEPFGVSPGGIWRPRGCEPRQRVAVIIPYRERRNHLHILLNHLYTVLVRQNMHVRVFVVEQSHPNIFNKAAMMDIAFLEARKLFPFDCVIFHDVDLLMEDDRNLYACVRQPRHIASHTDKHQYRLPYSSLFGGCTAFTADTFVRLNGYATEYWGWGGEDDNMYVRVTRLARTKPHRHPQALARFTMIRHERDQLFPPNIFKNKLIRDRALLSASLAKDGLSSIRYKVHAIRDRPLFTWIYAEPLCALTEFYSVQGSCRSQNGSYFRAELQIQDCAQKCKSDLKCVMFDFKYDEDWHPWCTIYGDKCESALGSAAANSYLYTKGRSL